MDDKTVNTARIVIAVLMLTMSIIAQAGEAPPWVGVLTGVIAAGLALVTRLEVIFDIDLDGDGRKGPRLPVWLIAGAGIALSHCGGGVQAVDIGEPAGYIGATGYSALTVSAGGIDGEMDGEATLDVSVPVCVKTGGGSTCVVLRVYGSAIGGVDVPADGQVCAELRAFGVVLAERCAGSTGE